MCNRAGNDRAPRCPPTPFAPGGETIPFRFFGDRNPEAFFQNSPNNKLERAGVNMDSWGLVGSDWNPNDTDSCDGMSG